MRPIALATPGVIPSRSRSAAMRSDSGLIIEQPRQERRGEPRETEQHPQLVERPGALDHEQDPGDDDDERDGDEDARREPFGLAEERPQPALSPARPKRLPSTSSAKPVPNQIATPSRWTNSKTS